MLRDMLTVAILTAILCVVVSLALVGLLAWPFVDWDVAVELYE